MLKIEAWIRYCSIIDRYNQVNAATAKSLQSCQTLWDPRDGSPPGSRPWDSPGKNIRVGCRFLLQCMKVNSKVKSLSRVQFLATPWPAAHQAPPSMGFSRQEYWRVNLSLQSWNLLVSFAIHLTWFQQKWSTIKYLWAERATIKSEWPSEEAGTWTWGDTNVGYWESSRTEPVLISTVIGLPLCEHPGQPHAWWEYQRHSLYLPGLQGVKM